MSYESFSPQSRVWIYQSERPFTEIEKDEINRQVATFAKQWTAHNHQLKAWGGIVEDNILVLMVDETQAGASGCSIDTSVHFVQEMQNHYKTDFFNRLLVTYQDNSNWKTASIDEVESAYQSGAVSEDTLVINTLVQTKAEMEQNFRIPLKETWIAQRLN